MSTDQDSLRNSADDGGAQVVPRLSGATEPQRLSEGIYNSVPMGAYVADPCPEPSLSTGVVQALIERSPAHARLWHPRLGGSGDDASARGDIGSAIHSLVFGGPSVQYVTEVTKRSGKDKGLVVTAEDWKTADAQEARDAIRAAGAIPLLGHQRGMIESVAGAASELLATTFGTGRCEQTLIWQHRGVWCRGRADYRTSDGRFDVDLKTCDNADPAAWIRTVLFRGGLDIQMALRIIGGEQLDGHQREGVFLLAELERPFGASLVGVTPEVFELARRKINAAADIWRRCLDRNEWPAYRRDIHWAHLSSSAEWDFEARATHWGDQS